MAMPRVVAGTGPVRVGARRSGRSSRLRHDGDADAVQAGDVVSPTECPSRSDHDHGSAVACPPPIFFIFFFGPMRGPSMMSSRGRSPMLGDRIQDSTVCR